MKERCQSTMNRHFNEFKLNNKEDIGLQSDKFNLNIKQLQTNFTKSQNYDISINNSQIPGQSGQDSSSDQHRKNLKHSKRVQHPNQQKTRKTGSHLENMNTPITRTQIRPRRLFDDRNNVSSIGIDINLTDINLEFLLLNTLIINASKVQTVVYFASQKLKLTV